MQYKKYECKTFTIHTIKTDKFKNCLMEINFRKNIVKEDITKYNFLIDMLAMSNALYPTRRDVVLKLENLYSTGFRALSNRVGNAHVVSFVTNFINPEYCDEGYLEDVLRFSFDMLLSPNVVNDEFDLRTFTIEKNRMIAEINSLKESSTRYALKNCLTAMDDTSPTSYNMSGYLEDLEKITPSNLYEAYQQFLNEYICDIYVLGDLDMEEVCSIIKENFSLDTIKEYDIKLLVDNKERKKPNVINEVGDYQQSSLVMAYNLTDLTKRERDVVMHVYNMILGAGSLNCKLSKSLREENSLCYTCSSMYNKYDNLLLIYAGIDKKSYDLSVKLVKKAIKDMASGKIEQEEVEDNILQLVSSVKIGLDMPGSIINNYFFHDLDDAPLAEERIELLKSVTLKEIIAVAKKVKLNTVYLLSGGDA